MAWSYVTLLENSDLFTECRLTLSVLISAKQGKQSSHARGLIVIELARFVSDSLHFDLAQLDLAKLVLLILGLFDDEAEVALADLAVTVLLVDRVLCFHCAKLPVLRVNYLRLVVPLLDEVFVDYVDGARGHLLLIFLIDAGKLVDDFFIAVLELVSVLNL